MSVGPFKVITLLDHIVYSYSIAFVQNCFRTLKINLSTFMSILSKEQTLFFAGGFGFW